MTLKVGVHKKFKIYWGSQTFGKNTHCNMISVKA